MGAGTQTKTRRDYQVRRLMRYLDTMDDYGVELAADLLAYFSRFSEVSERATRRSLVGAVSKILVEFEAGMPPQLRIAPG